MHKKKAKEFKLKESWRLGLHLPKRTESNIAKPFKLTNIAVIA